MRLLRPATPGQLSLGLTILRVVTGIVFAVHGGQKLFVFGLDGVAGGLGQMGVPLPGLVAPAIALLESLGGLALVVGFLTRLAALGLAAEMLSAMVLVHIPNGFFLPNGYEFVLLLFAAAATLVVTGAGAWSLDARIARRERAAVGDDRPVRRAA